MLGDLRSSKPMSVPVNCPPECVYFLIKHGCKLGHCVNGKVSHVFNVGEENDYREECQTIGIREFGKCSVWRKFAFLFLCFFSFLFMVVIL